MQSHCLPLNCTVDLQFIWISELPNTTNLAIAGNEKIDLIHVGTVQPLSSLVGADILYDMNTDDLLQKAWSGIGIAVWKAA